MLERVDKTEYLNYLTLKSKLKELWKNKGAYFSFNLTYFTKKKRGKKETIYSLYIYEILGKDGDKTIYRRPKKVYKSFDNMLTFMETFNNERD